jgi:hypothetical protein
VRSSPIHSEAALSSIKLAVPQKPATIDDLEKKLKDASVAIAKLESVQRMMEISQIGTFEYDPKGQLIRANVRDSHTLTPLSFLLGNLTFSSHVDTNEP